MTPREYNARSMRDLPVYNAMQRILHPILGDIHATRIDAYIEDLLNMCRCGDDPVLERMVQQFELANQRLTVLQTRTADATSLDAAVKYSQMADRLMAELRRTALAIRQYRTPTNKATTVIHRIEQMNMAEGDQRVNYERAEAHSGGSSRRMQTRNNEKASKENGKSAHESRFSFDIEEPKEVGSGTLEPTAAAGVDA